MATSSSDDVWKMMSEYNFEMIDEVTSDMICTICNKVMINACIGLCGCRYCIGCIRNHLTGENKFCPRGLKFCNRKMINIDENVNLDHSVNFRIISSVVKCPLGPCQHRDELQNIADHLRTCKSRPVNCPYFNMGCDKDLLGGDKIKDHLEIENYGHTKLLIEYVDNLKNEMELLKGELAELRQDNNRHKLDGERRQVAIGELQANVKVNCEQVALLNEEMSALKNENRSMKQQINNLTQADRQNQVAIGELQANLKVDCEQVALLNEEMSALKNDNRSTKQQINNLTQADRQNQVAIGELQAKLDGQSRQIDQSKDRSDQSAKSIKEIEDKTENLHLKMFRMQTNLDKQNEFVWVIENISDKIKQAKNGITREIFSHAFYTHKNGYKMCLNVPPGGVGTGKGSHLSVFFCVMKGPFDEILSWPFKGDVTFSLMNLQSGLVHVAITVKYEKYPNSPAYLKPTNERNIVIGHQQFIKLDQLLSNNQLVKNDKIVITVNIKLIN